jgi:cobyrinic acid a,c-diamide synthase
MKTAKIPRFMIVGTGSGSGKTTVVCAILKAIQNRGLRLASFKCGPDYIDPMFHTKVIGAKSRNLDLYMCDEKKVKYLFAENSKNTDLSIIEGVMGMYDGLISNSDTYSSNHLALVTNTPEILVVNTKGMSLSVVAQIFGYLNFKKNKISGIILNNTNEKMYPIFKKIIEDELNIKVFGYMRTINEAVIKSRHLGLITAEEIEDINIKLDILSKEAEKTIDIDGLISLSKENEDFSYEDIKITNIIPNNSIRIGVARDKAFCFYYEDNLELLKKLGAEIVYFSPLLDDAIPKNLNGLIFGGGYPEEYANRLSENINMLESVKTAILRDMPVISECGGYMYLCNSITDRDGKEHKMVGVINSKAKMTNKLSRFGYVMLCANKNNILVKKGESIRGHEFHYSDSDNNGNSFTAKKDSGKIWECIHTDNNIFAGYPHIHFWGNIDFAKSFILKCKENRDEFTRSDIKY